MTDADKLAMAVYRIGLKSNGEYKKLGLIWGDGSEPTDEMIERCAETYNACAGLTSEQLKNVKKAVIVAYVRDNLLDYDEEGLSWVKNLSGAARIPVFAETKTEELLYKLIEARECNVDFGELNELIDSCKERL